VKRSDVLFAVSRNEMAVDVDGPDVTAVSDIETSSGIYRFC
jgi:hypothetical protein